MMRARSEGDVDAAPCPAVDVRFPSRTEYLSLLRPITEWFTQRCGFGKRDRARIVLSVVEATTNIIRHAYQGDPDQLIALSLRRLADSLEIEFIDTGKGVRPHGLPCGKAGKLRPGGLGVRMMKSCMDDVVYRALPGGGARLILRKRYARPATAASRRRQTSGKKP